MSTIIQKLLGLTFFLSLSSCAALSFQQARELVDWTEDIVYVENSQNPRHRLDLYYPKTISNYPVLVFVHGGFWVSQDKQYFQAFTGLYGNIGIELAKRGIGVASINYRLSPESKIEGQLHDVTRAVQWIKEHIHQYGGNNQQIFLGGHSAGGHLIALLGSDPRYLKPTGLQTYIKGYIPMSAIFDIPHMQKNNKESFNKDITYPVFGKSKNNWIHYSPKTYLNTQKKPFFILYGGKDYDYIREQTQYLLEKMGDLASSVSAMQVFGYTHEDMVLKIGQKPDLISDAISRFIKRTIKN